MEVQRTSCGGRTPKYESSKPYPPAGSGSDIDWGRIGSISMTIFVTISNFYLVFRTSKSNEPQIEPHGRALGERGGDESRRGGASPWWKRTRIPLGDHSYSVVRYA